LEAAVVEKREGKAEEVMMRDMMQSEECSECREEGRL